MSPDLQNRLEKRLAELCGDKVPGASVALTDGSTVITAVHGVTSLRDPNPVKPATLFQIGSITKVYTATLIMALVDQGKVDLDAPVRTYLPSFALGDGEVAAAVTIRHLLCHTAGFEGDDFTDTGRGDDALATYVDGLSKAAQIHPLGAMFSYCNSGFSTLGLVVEAVTGGSWDDAVQSMLAQPLGVTLTTLAEQAILHPVALGHLELPTSAEPDAPTALQVAPLWAPPRSVAPAGTICSSASDVLAFGRAHLEASVLTPESVALMQTEQVLMDDPWTLGKAWGLGWILPTDGVIGHDGATFGQYAFYRLHPESGTAMCLLTNGPGARAVYQALFTEFFAELSGVPMPPSATPPSTRGALDLDTVIGDYQRQEVRLEVRAVADDPGAVDIAMVPLGPTAALAGSIKPLRCVALDASTVVTAEPYAGSGVHMTARFITPEGADKAAWIHFGARATPRLT